MSLIPACFGWTRTDFPCAVLLGSVLESVLEKEAQNFQGIMLYQSVRTARLCVAEDRSLCTCSCEKTVL